MQVALNSRIRNIAFLAATVLASTAFVLVSTLHFAADYLSNSPSRLQLAVKLAPGNAEYHALFGRFLFHTRAVPAALQQFKIAAALNPHNASYWMAIAQSNQVLDHAPEQGYALKRALEDDPTTPGLAWTAANYFLVQGNIEAALQEFKVVVANDSSKAGAAFVLCSRVADVPTIVDKVLPTDPEAYLSLIDFLTYKKNTADAIRAWSALVKLGKPPELRPALAFVDYLIAQHEVDAARITWEQAIQLRGLSAYLGSRENLIVNSQFDSDILNGGFDWRYRRQPNVEVALDPLEYQDGRRSLNVVFDGPGVSDAGIRQYVAVEPESDYQIMAYFKAETMEGAGGPRVSIQDAYTGTEYFSSPDLRGQDAWSEFSGQFRTGSDTRLISIQLLRVPSGSPLRGRLWLDGFRLTEKSTGPNGL